MAVNRINWWPLVLMFLAVLTGCNALRQPAAESMRKEAVWVGRFSLTHARDGAPTERMTTSFELTGDAQNGELVLEGPLGARLARAHWGHQQAAVLERNGQVESFPNMTALTAAVVGQPLPIEALFQWLKGVEAKAPPWSVDLTQWPTGRITATQVMGTDSVRMVVLFDPRPPATSAPTP